MKEKDKIYVPIILCVIGDKSIGKIEIDFHDDGTYSISAKDKEKAEKLIEEITNEKS